MDPAAWPWGKPSCVDRVRHRIFDFLETTEFEWREDIPVRARSPITSAPVAMATLLVLGPVFLALTLAARLATRGPIFDRRVIGRWDGAPVELLVFRTDEGKFGRFMRRYAFETLPFLIDVARGNVPWAEGTTRRARAIRWLAAAAVTLFITTAGMSPAWDTGEDLTWADLRPKGPLTEALETVRMFGEHMTKDQIFAHFRTLPEYEEVSVHDMYEDVGDDIFDQPGVYLSDDGKRAVHRFWNPVLKRDRYLEWLRGDGASKQNIARITAMYDEAIMVQLGFGREDVQSRLDHCGVTRDHMRRYGVPKALLGWQRAWGKAGGYGERAYKEIEALGMYLAEKDSGGQVESEHTATLRLALVRKMLTRNRVVQRLIEQDEIGNRLGLHRAESIEGVKQRIQLLEDEIAYLEPFVLRRAVRLARGTWRQSRGVSTHIDRRAVDQSAARESRGRAVRQRGSRRGAVAASSSSDPPSTGDSDPPSAALVAGGGA